MTFTFLQWPRPCLPAAVGRDQPVGARTSVGSGRLATQGANSQLLLSSFYPPFHPNLPKSTNPTESAELLCPHFCLILYFSLPTPLLPASQPTPPVTQSQPTCSQMPTVSTWAISFNLSELICYSSGINCQRMTALNLIQVDVNLSNTVRTIGSEPAAPTSVRLFSVW